MANTHSAQPNGDPFLVMPLSKGITDKALPQCKDHTIIFFRIEKMCKEKEEYKKEKTNPFQKMRCHSYAKQWPPLGDEKL
jgi:hypothetical protein